MEIFGAAVQRAGFAPELRPACVALCALAIVGCVTPPLAPIATPDKILPASAVVDRGGAPDLTLGPGDAVTVQVYGRPELTVTTSVGGDGNISLPLVGSVPVAGLAPARAALRVATAYRQGKYLVDPQVTLALASSRGFQVSVLGAVKNPGRFVIDPRTTVLDALAQAGGVTENGGTVVVLLRPDKTGKISRYAVDMGGLNRARSPVPTLALRGGDSLFVPPADQFYIYGEVKSPNMYRLEPGMTVVQAISRGGGITPRGSDSRIEIKRVKPDGSTVTGSADLGDVLQANDVVRVKERIF